GSDATGSAAPAASTWPVPPGWRSEVIPFPLDFAPTLAHRGIEELRFPAGFFDPASPEFWSYAFIWRTDDAAELTAPALAAELTTYFKGLTAAVDDKRRVADTDRETIIARAEPAGGQGRPARFALTARTFDAFKTAKPVDLVGFAERRPCGSGALWVFVLAPATTTIRPQLESLAAAATCAR
nr:hypothetical protein [Myxococcota bacterium]